MQRVAIFPGSFDPFTRGHAALVEQATCLFDRVVVAIGNNSQKCGLLQVEDRKRLIEECFAHNEAVSVAIYSGLTVDFAREVGACALIRGVRNTIDFEYERTLEATNRRLEPQIATLMLFTPSDVADISSSTIRELISFGHDVEEFMPQGVSIKNYIKE